MKLKNGDLPRPVFAWQTAQMPKLPAATASIPDGAELRCGKQELQLNEKQVPWEPKLHVKMFLCGLSLWILSKELAVHNKLLT